MGLAPGTDSDMKMTAEHAHVLANALRLNKSVESLEVSLQPIGDEGLIAIVDALIANPETKLNYLNLSGCRITEHGAGYLLRNIDKIPSLRFVNLYSNSACSETIRNAIKQKLDACTIANSKASEAIHSENDNMRIGMFS